MVSIIIPNWNGGRFLEKCLNSLRKQSFKEFEIIIVDNGSTDNSNEIIEKKYPECKLLRMNKNYGFAYAVNRGIENSDTRYVVLLNNDVEVEEDWLEKLVKCIHNSDKIFSCSSKMIRYDERDRIDDAGDYYTLMGWTLKKGEGCQKQNYITNYSIFSSCGGAAIYRKEVLDKIGLFDESFFAYMEDVDICYRAKIYGYDNVFCHEANVYHIGSATSGSRYNSFKVKLAARNNIYVPYKNMPFFQLLINSPFLVMGYLIKYIYFVRKGLSKDYVEGIREGLKNLNKIHKVKYKNYNFWNYIKIQYELIFNIFLLFYNKFIN